MKKFASIKQIRNPQREVWSVESCHRYCKIYFLNGQLETECQKLKYFKKESEFQLKIECSNKN